MKKALELKQVNQPEHICNLPEIYQAVDNLAQEVDRSITTKDQIALEHLQTHARQIALEITKIINRKL